MRARFPRTRENVRLDYRAIALSFFIACGPVACARSDQNLAIALATPSPDARVARNAALASIYAAAKRRDESALLDMQRSAMASPDPAISLALLAIDRVRFAETFVRTYPTTRDALTDDYGATFARAHVVASGALFPIAALGTMALAGNTDAFTKLLGGAAVADGRIGDAYRAQARHVLAALAPGATFDAFAELPPATRFAAVSSIDWCAHRPTALLAFRPSPKPSSTPTPIASTSTPLASSATIGPSPNATPTPTPTPPVKPSPPTGAEIASLQGAIDHAATVDCALALRARIAPKVPKKANARVRKANPKTP